MNVNGTKIEVFAQQWFWGDWNYSGESVLLLWFCDIKYQIGLFASPVSCPQGRNIEKVSDTSSHGLSEGGTSRVLQEVRGCSGVQAGLTWDPTCLPKAAGWLVPVEEHRVPY